MMKIFDDLQTQLAKALEYNVTVSDCVDTEELPYVLFSNQKISSDYLQYGEHPVCSMLITYADERDNKASFIKTTEQIQKFLSKLSSRDIGVYGVLSLDTEFKNTRHMMTAQYKLILLGG